MTADRDLTAFRSTAVRKVRRAGTGVCVLALVLLLGACARQSPDELLASARQNIEREQWRAAMIDLKNLLQKDSGNAAAREALAKVTLRMGDFEAALTEVAAARRAGARGDEILSTEMQANMALHRHEAALAAFDREASARDIGSPEVWTLRGDSLLELGKAADAQAAFEQALARDGSYFDARVGRASARFHTEGIDAAREDIAEAEKLAPGDARVRMAMSEIYYANRQFVEAERELEKAVEIAGGVGKPPSQLTFALAGLARAQLSLGKESEADATTKRLIELAPQNLTAMYLRARALFIAGEYDPARLLLEQILTRVPGNTEAQLLLGAVTYAQGNLGQADMYLGSVVAADPDNGFARRLLVDVRLREGKTREAKQALPQDLGSGSDPALLALAGRASLQEGDLESGLAYLEQSAAARPDDPDLAIELASGYLSAGRFEQAVRLLEGMKGDERVERRRDLLLVVARLRAKDLPGALEETRAFVERHPRDAFGETLLGSLLQASGDRIEARRAYGRAIEAGPGAVAAHISLAKLDMIEKQPMAAERRLKRALDISPDNAAVLVTLAQLELSRDRPQDAVKWLELARTRNARAVEPRLLLAQYYLAQRDFDRAEAVANETLKFAPDNAPALNVLGLVQSARGNPEEGIRTLQKVAGSVATKVNLAKVYLANGRAADAIRACEEALAMRPDYQPGLILASALYIESNRLDRARALLQQLEKARPDHPLLAVFRGDIAYRERDFAAAAKSYASAPAGIVSTPLVIREYLARKSGKLPNAREPLARWLDRHPKDAVVRTALAQDYQDTGDVADAIRHYELALEQDPGHVVALNNLAWLYHGKGDERALDTARRAYENATKNGAVVDTYGWLTLLGGDAQKGAELLAQAQALAPDIPDIQYHYAVALHRTGKPGEARRLLDRLLASGAQFPERRDAEELAKSLRAGSGST